MGLTEFLLLICCFVPTLFAKDLGIFENAQEVSRANNKFSSDFYSILSAKNSHGNVVFSPFGLYQAVAMLKAGARNSTAEEIQRGMKFPPDSKLYFGCQLFEDQLKSNDLFTLDIANSIFPSKGFELSTNFVKTLEASFGAETKQLDYSDPILAAKQINEWVGAKTHGKIAELIYPDSLDGLTRMVLINSIFFKGKWVTPFDKDMTRQRDFFVSEDHTVKVDMMEMQAEILHGDLPEAGVSVVSLPYLGNQIRMLVLLPRANLGFRSLEKTLKDYGLEDIVGRLVERDVVLVLPKFKIESNIDLKVPLQDLGIKSIFYQSANFSGIPAAKDHVPLAVSTARSKVVIQVDEEGSEAAAVSSFLMEDRMVNSGTLFMVNRPFLAIIYSDSPKTGLTKLFVAAVRNPNEQVSEI